MNAKLIGLISFILLLTATSLTAQATDMDKISPYPLGERSIFSDRATSERLAPVGHVCVKGEKCVNESASSGADKTASTQPEKKSLTPKEIFDKHCSACHKTGAMGAPKFGNDDDWAPHIAKGKKTLYHSALHGFKAMPPRGMCTECTDDEIKATVRFMVNHSGGHFKK